MSKKFINDPKDVVEEMVQGLLLCDNNLRKVDGHNVIVRSDIQSYLKNNVTLISGGGSGHEPAHAGFIGQGMLSGAVLGGMFASPSVIAVLTAIRTCTMVGAPGCLLIVKNYTGDRLNFGRALEQAKSEGLNVKMVVVADDCAQPRDKGITGRRGVAGTVFVHKIAGACAQTGASLDQVYNEAVAASEAIGSLGVALTTCTLPGQPISDRLAGNKIEIGLGIHGEPGVKQLDQPLPADEMVDAMVEAIIYTKPQAYLAIKKGDEVAMLINNLGGTPTMELYICARRAVEQIEKTGAIVTRVFVGPFMTSIEMQGVSLSIVKLTALSAARLDASTTAPAWLPASTRHSSCSSTIAAPVVESVQQDLGNVPIADTGKALAVLQSMCRALSDTEAQLTEWDLRVGDGDCGITMKRGAEAITGAYKTLPLSNATALLSKVADIVSDSMGGTSGALFEIGLRAAATAIKADKQWSTAFVAAVEAIKFYGGADKGYRTMLDALIPASDIISSTTFSNTHTEWMAAVDAAEKGAEETKDMAALAGRSNWVPEEKLKDTPDPGAKAVATILGALVAKSFQ